MIGVSSSSRSFTTLGRYLVAGRSGDAEGRIAWSSGRNLPTDDPILGAKIMRASASQNVRVAQPVYHLALSFDPSDKVDRAAMERVADRVLAELRLHEHQAIIVAHADRAHPHMHILINRVHPETGRVWDRWQDYPAIQRVLREEERALGVRQVDGRTLATERNAVDVAGRIEARPDLREAASRVEQSANGATASIRAISADLATHERVSELSRQNYSADRDVAAAAARRDQVETGVERIARADAAFESALARAYVDPISAKQAFLANAERDGEREAAHRMRDQPEHYGRLLPDRDRGANVARADSITASARVATREAAGYGVELLAARREIAKLVERQPSKDVRLFPIEVPAMIRQKAADEVLAAQARLDAVRQAQKGLPSRDVLDHRLTRALQRLSPPEVEKLRAVLSPQRFMIAHQLRRMVRDAALGRADEQ